MGGLMLGTPNVSAVKKGLAVTKNFVIKQSPIILTCAGVGGVITTGVLAHQAGIKATRLIEEARNEKFGSENGELSTRDKIQASWKAYIPTAISAGLTIAAIVGSSAISQKRQAALAGLYAISETALKEYQEKVEKEYGPKKEQAIRDAINDDKVKQTVVPSQYDILPDGKVLVKDKLSGRVFLSSSHEIRKAANDINYRIMAGDMVASLNEFYEEIGLDGIDLGEECGWNLGNQCLPYFTSALTSDMRPVLVLDWERGNGPVVNYRDI